MFLKATLTLFLLSAFFFSFLIYPVRPLFSNCPGVHRIQPRVSSLRETSVDADVKYGESDYRPFYCRHVSSTLQTFLACSYLLLRRLFAVLSLNPSIYLYHLLPAAPCSANTFFCHSNMCINNSLVCNGVQNCVYPWDENHCKGKHPSLVEVFTVGYFG